MKERLLTSAEAAELLGASPTSVKRWADAGLLPCVRTVGKHRRFRRAALEAFARGERGVAAPSEPGSLEMPTPRSARASRITEPLGRVKEPLGRGVDEDSPLALLPHLLERSVPAVQGHLLSQKARFGSWAAVCERIGPVVSELGAAWVEGRLTIVDEHLASNRLQRALATVSDSIVLPANAPNALLTAALDDEHTLGLSLVEVTLREAGWRTLWSGRKTPLTELPEALSTRDARLLVVSASSYSSNEERLAAYADELAKISRRTGCALLAGGSGAWPDPMPVGELIRSFRALSQFARELAARSR